MDPEGARLLSVIVAPPVAYAYCINIHHYAPRRIVQARCATDTGLHALRRQ